MHHFHYRNNELFCEEIPVRDIVRDELNQVVGNLPTKDEFTAAMSELMGEVKSMREEFTVVEGHKDQLEDHEERLETIETKLNIAVS